MASSSSTEEKIEEQDPVTIKMTFGEIEMKTSITQIEIVGIFKIPQSPPQPPTESFKYKPELHQAAFNGDWEKAKEIFIDGTGVTMNTAITSTGKTALHIAAASEQTEFVQKLITEMERNQSLSMLRTKDKGGHTALYFAVVAGNMEAAEAMVEKSPQLATISNNYEVSPILEAARLGDKKLLDYLFLRTIGHNLNSDEEKVFKGEAGVKLLNAMITADFYTRALDLVSKYKNVAVEKENGQSALGVLARKSIAFESGTQSRCLGRTNSSIQEKKSSSTSRRKGKFIGGQSAQIEIPESKNPQEQLVKCICNEIFELDNLSDINDLVQQPFLDAAEHGSVGFMVTCLKYFPQLISVHDRSHTILHKCIIHRQEQVFELLDNEWSAHRTTLALYHDKEGNNILHLAAKLAPSDKVSGAALQMQRAMQWYKAVKEITKPMLKDKENSRGVTPHALFVNEHKILVKNGEKWMRSLAASCSLVATLIATMVFAVAFNVPGGYNGDKGAPKGIPVFTGSKCFVWFALSDAIALASSLTSVLIFLSVLTSRYSEEDFLVILPRKIILGLVTLYLSIIAMAIAFTSTYFMMFSTDYKQVPFFVAAFFAFPIGTFGLLQLPLFVEVVVSTYGYRVLQRQR